MNNRQSPTGSPKISPLGWFAILCGLLVVIAFTIAKLPDWLQFTVACIAFILAVLALAKYGAVGKTVKRSFRRMRSRIGLGKTIVELARRLSISVDELRCFEPFYQPTTIPKRSGSKRILFIPDAKTKTLQRRLLCRVLQRLCAHPCAKGFEKGQSIVTHAKDHVGQTVLVHVDIVDFFPTTTAERVEHYFRQIGWNREAAQILTKLTTWENGLPQGAPTSPRLSNLVNYILDAQLAHMAYRRDAIYSRYADDITFSFAEDKPKRIRGAIQKIRRMLKSKGYEMHRRKKLHIRRRHQRQEVTGLIVNEKVQLPRKTRRWLRAVLHHQKTGKPTTLTDKQIEGWLAFVNMVNQQKELKNRPI